MRAELNANGIGYSEVNGVYEAVGFVCKVGNRFNGDSIEYVFNNMSLKEGFKLIFIRTYIIYNLKIYS